MLSVRFVVPGEPVPYMRPAPGLKGGRIVPKREREWRQRVVIHFCQQRHGAPPLVGPLSLEAVFYRSTLRRADCSNLVKSVEDALNGVAYADDSQVVVLHAEKRLDRACPRAEVTITQREESWFQD